MVGVHLTSQLARFVSFLRRFEILCLKHSLAPALSGCSFEIADTLTSTCVVLSSLSS